MKKFKNISSHTSNEVADNLENELPEEEGHHAFFDASNPPYSSTLNVVTNLTNELSVPEKQFSAQSSIENEVNSASQENNSPAVISNSGSTSMNSVSPFYIAETSETRTAPETKNMKMIQKNVRRNTRKKFIDKSKYRISFANKLIPIFKGVEEDDVEHWLNRVSTVANLYELKEKEIMLAVITKLRNRALKWYNRQPIETMRHWENFKTQVQSYFKREASVSTSMIKVTRRFWNMRDEKFADYAAEKMYLMVPLRLSNKDQIELLVDGVKEPTLRMIILGASFSDISDLVNHVRKITEDKVISKHLSDYYSKNHNCD